LQQEQIAIALPAARALSWKLIALRIVLVILGLAVWFGTQSAIGARHRATGSLPIEADGLLEALTPAHDYLQQHVAARNALLISSSTVINVLAFFILGRAIFGPSIRPFLGLLILFGLRQIFQALCVLPAPDGMLWENPGFPGLLVTYGVSNDLFFSGHTAMAVYGAVELARLSRRWIVVGVIVAVFEAVSVLALRAHWTMDVYAGAVTALLVACIVGRLSEPVDRLLGNLSGTRRQLPP
jgi:membrane-associated phospholipid phosphatase